MLPLNCFLQKLLSTRSCYICYSASRKNRVGHFSASILCLDSTSQCTFNLHMFFNIVHQISKGEHKISHVFSLVLPRTFFSESWLKKVQPTIWSQYHNWRIQNTCIPKLYYHDTFYKTLAHNLLINTRSRTVSYF